MVLTTSSRYPEPPNTKISLWPPYSKYSRMPHVSAAQYGKDNVRVYKVHKDEKTGVQTVVEMTVCVLLRGDIESSYVAIIAPLSND